MKYYISGLFLMFFLCVWSVEYRWDSLTGNSGAENLEATYHVIHTVDSLQSSSWRNHFYLPTVTLGRSLDKDIPWAAAKPSYTGDYIYTSFPPLGFIAPYAVLSMLGLEGNRMTIGLFGAALGLMSSLCLYTLCYRLMVFGGLPSRTSAMAALGGCLISVFSREALQSNGVVYWSHTFYNFLLVATILTLVSYRIDRRKAYAVLFYALVFLGPWVEWTAYFVSAGLIVFLVRKPSLDPQLSAFRVAAVTFLSGALVYLHFVLVLGLVPATHAFLARFLARSAAKVGIESLVAGYGISYGLFLFVILALIFVYAMKEREGVVGREKFIYIKLVLLVSCFPLVENIVMMQHAAQFSFDRLKFIIPASIFIAVSIGYLRGFYRYCCILFLIVASVLGSRDFSRSLQSYRDWAGIDNANVALVSKSAPLYDMSCTIFASSGPVRAYLNTLFHVSIYQNKKIDDLAALMASRKACAAVFVETSSPFIDLVRLEKVTIVKPDGQQIVVN